MVLIMLSALATLNLSDSANALIYQCHTILYEDLFLPYDRL